MWVFSLGFRVLLMLIVIMMRQNEDDACLQALLDDEDDDDDARPASFLSCQKRVFTAPARRNVTS